MANPLYQSMNNQQSNILQAFKQNPVQFLAQRNLNIPQNIANDPNAIIQHLMGTGQVSQAQYNRAMQIIQQFR